MSRYADEFQLKFDEINALTTTSYEEARRLYGGNNAEVAKKVADDILSIMINGYSLGVRHVSEMLNLPIGGGDPYFFTDEVRNSVLTSTELDELEEALFVLIDGKTFEDRVLDHVIDDKPNMLGVLAETEYHRVYNTGGYNTAKSADGDLYKTWLTELDDKVRETHMWLESVSVPVNEKFYTIDGDEAMYPGMFNNASNNVNCRCILEYEYVSEDVNKTQTETTD